MIIAEARYLSVKSFEIRLSNCRLNSIEEVILIVAQALRCQGLHNELGLAVWPCARLRVRKQSSEAKCAVCMLRCQSLRHA